MKNFEKFSSLRIIHFYVYLMFSKFLFCKCFFYWGSDELERVKKSRDWCFTFKTCLAHDLSIQNHIRWYFQSLFYNRFFFFCWRSDELEKGVKRQRWIFLYSKYVLRTICILTIIFDVSKFYTVVVFLFLLTLWSAWKGEKWQICMIYIQNTSCTRFE